MEGAESFSSTELMAPFHLSSIESIRVIIKYLKCRMSDHNNIPSMSGQSQAENLESDIRQSDQLVMDPLEREAVCLSKKLVKTVFIVILLVVAGLMAKHLIMESFSRRRTPTTLSAMSFTRAPETISPAEKDYRSFVFYEELVEKSKQLERLDKKPGKEDEKGFMEINFQQFYNVFKVIKTVQIAKSYEAVEDSVKIIDVDINTPVNHTDGFLDAVDQFRCSSCYSFPIIATAEYLYRTRYNITVKLSEQQLIDCVNEDPTVNGCEGGNLKKGFEYVMKHGLVRSQEYPYRSLSGQSFPCNKTIIDSPDVKKYKISGFRELPSGNCTAIQDQLINNYAVATMMNAENLGSEVYDQANPFTDCKRSGFNHAITIVGQTEKNEWIVRNSWGKGWGNNGYFIMGHGNTCGVCLNAIVPELFMGAEGEVLPFEDIKDVKPHSK